MRAFEVNNKLLKDKGMELQPFGDNQMQFSNKEFVLTLSEHNFLDIYHKNTGRRRLCDMVFDILTPGHFIFH